MNTQLPYQQLPFKRKEQLPIMQHPYQFPNIQYPQGEQYRQGYIEPWKQQYKPMNVYKSMVPASPQMQIPGGNNMFNGSYSTSNGMVSTNQYNNQFVNPYMGGDNTTASSLQSSLLKQKLLQFNQNYERYDRYGNNGNIYNPNKNNPNVTNPNLDNPNMNPNMRGLPSYQNTPTTCSITTYPTMTQSSSGGIYSDNTIHNQVRPAYANALKNKIMITDTNENNNINDKSDSAHRYDLCRSVVTQSSPSIQEYFPTTAVENIFTRRNSQMKESLLMKQLQLGTENKQSDCVVKSKHMFTDCSEDKESVDLETNSPALIHQYIPDCPEELELNIQSIMGDVSLLC